MLIDISYFTVGSRHIQNASTAEMPNQNNISVNEVINWYIEQYQEEFLCEMLGFSLGADVNFYLIELDTDSAKERNKQYDEICDKIKYMFADYVFFHILRNCQTQSTTTGLVLLKNANEYVAPINRQVATWNHMVERNEVFQAWCKTNLCPIPNIEVSTNLLTPINNLNL